MVPTLVALLVLGAAPSAGAQEPPACAPAPDAIAAPADLSDTDRLVRELRGARIEAAATCVALADRLASVKASTAATSVDVADLLTLAETTGVAVRTPAGAPAPDAQTVTLAEGDRTWLAATGTAMRADVWAVVGVLGALFLGYFLIRRDA